VTEHETEDYAFARALFRVNMNEEELLLAILVGIAVVLAIMAFAIVALG
jgi:cytosine/uracil/thiamine/allantoin permease